VKENGGQHARQEGDRALTPNRLQKMEAMSTENTQNDEMNAKKRGILPSHPTTSASVRGNASGDLTEMITMITMITKTVKLDYRRQGGSIGFKYPGFTRMIDCMSLTFRIATPLAGEMVWETVLLHWLDGFLM
jgi:hypothetical protein